MTDESIWKKVSIPIDILVTNDDYILIKAVMYELCRLANEKILEMVMTKNKSFAQTEEKDVIEIQKFVHAHAILICKQIETEASKLMLDLDENSLEQLKILHKKLRKHIKMCNVNEVRELIQRHATNEKFKKFVELYEEYFDFRAHFNALCKIELACFALICHDYSKIVKAKYDAQQSGDNESYEKFVNDEDGFKDKFAQCEWHYWTEFEWSYFVDMLR